jgi:hypothetical protein
MKTGGCLCGAIKYFVTGELRPVVACHCVQCRTTTGHHVAATSAKREAITVNGKVTWYKSSDTAKRGFCGTCGSNLFWDGPGQNMSIMAGTLNTPTGLTLAGHIFCADKGDYYEIADGTPQAAQANDTLTTQVI